MSVQDKISAMKSGAKPGERQDIWCGMPSFAKRYYLLTDPGAGRPVQRRLFQQLGEGVADGLVGPLGAAGRLAGEFAEDGAAAAAPGQGVIVEGDAQAVVSGQEPAVGGAEFARLAVGVQACRNAPQAVAAGSAAPGKLFGKHLP